MNSDSEKPFTVKNVVAFFEEMAGVQFIDAKTQRPVLELVKEAQRPKKSDYELWLEEQEKSENLEHQEMGEG